MRHWPTPAALYAIAVAAYLAGFTGALHSHPAPSARLNALNQQLAQQPTNHELYLQRAWLAILAGHHSDAEADLARADALQTSYQSSYYRGLIASQRGNHQQALSYFDAAIAQAPNTSRLYQSRAHSHAALTHTAAALSDYRQALLFTPAAQASHYLDIATQVLQLTGYEQALTVIDSGHSRLGFNPQLQQYAVSLCLRFGAYEQAQQRHESLATTMATNPQWYVEYADILLLNNARTAATDALTKAQQLLITMKRTPWAEALRRDVNKKLARLQQR